MSIEALIGQFGPVVLVIGAGLEGETVAMIGGMVAHRGLISLPMAWVAVLAGTMLADQGFFFVGRHLRHRPALARFRASPTMKKAQARFEKAPALFILIFRFLYGLRTASPLVIGISGFSPARFALLNLIAAVVWSALFVGIGYAFGLGLDAALGRIAHHRDWLPYLLIPLAAGLAIWSVRIIRRCHIASSSRKASGD